MFKCLPFIYPLYQETSLFLYLNIQVPTDHQATALQKTRTTDVSNPRCALFINVYDYEGLFIPFEQRIEILTSLYTVFRLHLSSLGLRFWTFHARSH